MQRRERWDPVSASMLTPWEQEGMKATEGRVSPQTYTVTSPPSDTCPKQHSRREGRAKLPPPISNTGLLAHIRLRPHSPEFFWYLVLYDNDLYNIIKVFNATN